MEFIDIKDNFKRNYEEEKKILKNFSSILKSYISKSEILDRLDKNDFQGVYILGDKEFSELEESKFVLGRYDEDTKSIVLRANAYYNDETIGIHEMGHAFLNGRNRVELPFDIRNVVYGNGLEEGAVTLLSFTKRVTDISKVNKYVYFDVSRLFQQLNELYQYTSIKKYPNLLIHMFKEPEGFIKLVNEMYLDILDNRHSFDSSLISKSAFHMIQGADTLIETKGDDIIFCYLQLINSLYLSIADKNICNGRTTNPLFLKTELFNTTDEEKLLQYIFGEDSPYLKRYESILNKILGDLVHLFDTEHLNTNNGPKKILLPR